MTRLAVLAAISVYTAVTGHGRGPGSHTLQGRQAAAATTGWDCISVVLAAIGDCYHEHPNR